MKNNVEEVLVPPCDVILVFLVEWMKQVLPQQAASNHAVLQYWERQVIFLNTESGGLL